MSQGQTQYYHHGRFRVKGGVIPNAITAFRTYGDPKDPCIVFPTCYGGKLDSQLYMVGSGKGGNTQPYSQPAPYNGPYFPAVSYEDNIRAQYAVLANKLGIREIFLVIGFSMGGQQAYYWPVVYPEYVRRRAIFLEGPKAALTVSKDFDNGHYKSTPQHGLRAFGRAWFRNYGYLQSGLFPDLDTFLREKWEERFLTSWDANDLLTLLSTWQSGDISLVRDGGDLQKCLSSIKARGLIMPCKTDLYFPPEDNEIEVSHCQNTARLVVIDSVWGHMSGGGSNPEDDKFIQDEVKKFLEEK
ncbi:alpha beta hydrolase fold protein [Lyophyllum atratum]|nr:alpha beta hydrolase fold protein [Lyophyllum atratum]